MDNEDTKRLLSICTSLSAATDNLSKEVVRQEKRIRKLEQNAAITNGALGVLRDRKNQDGMKYCEEWRNNT